MEMCIPAEMEDKTISVGFSFLPTGCWRTRYPFIIRLNDFLLFFWLRLLLL